MRSVGEAALAEKPRDAAAPGSVGALKREPAPVASVPVPNVISLGPPREREDSGTSGPKDTDGSSSDGSDQQPPEIRSSETSPADARSAPPVVGEADPLRAIRSSLRERPAEDAQPRARRWPFGRFTLSGRATADQFDTPPPIPETDPPAAELGSDTRVRGWRFGRQKVRGRATAEQADMAPPVAIAPLVLDHPAETVVEPEPFRRRQKLKRSWREQRWERRRRRRAAEEVLGWIVVPVILITGYWAIKAGLGALGTTPTALFQGLKAAFSGRS